MSKKILIVEDHPLMRGMLREFIDALPDFLVVSTARTGEEALQQLEKDTPDLLLIDVSLPEMSGIDFVRTVKASWPHLPCLMLTGHQETSYVERALAAGAQGYVLKGDPFDLLAAIEHVGSGQVYLSQSIRNKMEDPAPL